MPNLPLPKPKHWRQTKKLGMKNQGQTNCWQTESQNWRTFQKFDEDFFFYWAPFQQPPTINPLSETEYGVKTS